MKKFAIVAIVITVVLGIAWAQDAGQQPRRGPAGGRPGNMSEEQRNAMRERFANMSEEERAKLREQMQARGGFGGGIGRGGVRLSQEDQLAAVKVIQEQAAKLKASVESYERPDREAMQDMSQEERTKFFEKMRSSFNERSQIIAAMQEKITALSMRPPAPTVTREDIREMGEIQKLAAEEKATKTSARLEKLVAKFRGGARGGMMGTPRQPRTEGDAPPRRPGRTRGEREGNADPGDRTDGPARRTRGGQEGNNQ